MYSVLGTKKKKEKEKKKEWPRNCMSMQLKMLMEAAHKNII